MHIYMSIEVLSGVLLGPLADILKVMTSMNHFGNFFRFMIFFYPCPRKWRNVTGAHQTLPQSVDAVLYMIKTHELMLPFKCFVGVETLAYHVLKQSRLVSAVVFDVQVRYQGKPYQAMELVEDV